MNKIYRSTYFLAFVIYVLYALIIPHKGMEYDMQCWADWSSHIFEKGLKNIYDVSNYLPGHLYEMKLYTLLFDSKEEVAGHIYYLKYVTLLFDVIGALLVCSFASGKSEQKMLLLAVMMNPAILHNSIIWGQFDSVFCCFAFASVLAIYHRKFTLASVLYLISLNLKLQAIIFLPALILYFIYQSGLKINWRKLLRGALLVILLQVIILLPFIMNHTVGKVWGTIKGLSAGYNSISFFAANIWFLLLKADLRTTFDNMVYASIPLKRWGQIMHSFALLIAIMPLLIGIYNKIKGRVYELSLPRVLLIFALSALVFFYFNTQMHERYSYPAFLFLAAYSFLTGRWWLYGIFSMAYFLNNDSLLHTINVINYYSRIFELSNVSLLFLTTTFLSFVLLYWKENRKQLL